MECMFDEKLDTLTARYLQKGICQTVEDAKAAVDRFLASAQRHADKELKKQRRQQTNLQTSFTLGDMLYASSSTRLSELVNLAVGKSLISSGVGTIPLVEFDLLTTAPASETTCCICLERPVSHICIPCGHFCLCEGCLLKPGAPCPICRAHVTQIIKVFKA